MRRHDGLGVQRPALGVGAVEGERGAGDRHAALDHRCELQLVAGACFMRRHRPGCGLRREVIRRIRRFRIRIAQRQHEFSEFALVAEEARRFHVGRGNGCRFGLACEPDRCAALRQSNDLLAHDDVFDLLQPLAIERQDPLGWHLLALQLAQDLPVVARVELAFACDLRGEARDLLAHLGKRQHAERNGLLRRNVDADRFQSVGIQLVRQRVSFRALGRTTSRTHSQCARNWAASRSWALCQSRISLARNNSAMPAM